MLLLLSLVSLYRVLRLTLKEAMIDPLISPLDLNQSLIYLLVRARKCVKAGGMRQLAMPLREEEVRCNLMQESTCRDKECQLTTEKETATRGQISPKIKDHSQIGE